MESLPIVFWVFYSLVFLTSLVTSLIYWIKRKYSALAAIGLILSLLLPLVSLVYTAQRNIGNELQYLKEQLVSWESLAIAIIIGYAFIVSWLILLFVKGMKKLYQVPFINKKLGPIFREKLHPLWEKWINYMKRALQRKQTETEQTAKETEKEAQ